MKQKLFNVVVYGMLTYSIVNGVYIALPPELQAMIPQWNDLLAIVSGGSTALIGLGGVKVQEYLNRAKSEAHSKYTLLANNYLELEKKYDTLAVQFKQITNLQNETIKQLTVNNKLLTVHLEVKKSDALIDEAAKQLIEGVLNEK